MNLRGFVGRIEAAGGCHIKDDVAVGMSYLTTSYSMWVSQVNSQEVFIIGLFLVIIGNEQQFLRHKTTVLSKSLAPIYFKK
jgi:hypothetical protein